MKVETKKEKNECVVNLIVSASADEIKDEYKKVLTVFLRQGQIPGFRRGKVPPELIKSKFAAEIKQEAIQACFHALYPKAKDEAKLDIVALDGLAEVNLDPATGFNFTAVVEVKPEVSLPKYKKLPIKKGDATVKDADVDAQIEAMRRSLAKFDDAKDGDVVGEGDFVNFDYKGFLKGQPLSEIVPDQKAVCEAVGFWTQIEEGRFLPEILEALKGMKIGEEKKGVKVGFPKDAAPDALKGKKCEYDLVVKGFRTRKLADDAQLLADSKMETMDALRADIRKHLEERAAAMELADRKNQAVSLLLKKTDFDVPPSFVQRQVDAELNMLAQRAQYMGMTADYIKENREKILADTEAHATDQVRLSFLLEAIAKAENIDTKDEKFGEKVMDLILAEAK